MTNMWVLRFAEASVCFSRVVTGHKTVVACQGIGPVSAPKQVDILPYSVEDPLPRDALLLAKAARNWKAANWTPEELATKLSGEHIGLSSYWCRREWLGANLGHIGTWGLLLRSVNWLRQLFTNPVKVHSEDAVEDMCKQELAQNTTVAAADFFRELSRKSLIDENVSDARRLGLEIPMVRADPRIFERHPELLEDFNPAELSSGQLTRQGYWFSTSLWAGPAHAQTGLHADMDPGNFLVHLGPGRKSVALFPPEAASLVDAADELAEDGAWYAAGDADLFAPDLLQHFPGMVSLCRRARLYQVVLEVGDVLYIPCGWFHQVRYLENASISVSISIMPPKPKHDPPPIPGLNRRQCYRVLQNMCLNSLSSGGDL